MSKRTIKKRSKMIKASSEEPMSFKESLPTIIVLSTIISTSYGLVWSINRGYGFEYLLGLSAVVALLCIYTESTKDTQ